MKIFAWATTAVLAVFLVAIVILVAQDQGLYGTVSRQQAQITRLQSAAHDSAATATATELKTLRADVTALTARLNGQHKDVITCGDLQNMGLNYYWQDSNYNLQSNPVTLPGHCINQ